VGKRHGKAIVLRIRAAELNRDGFEFYLSANGVWLTNYVPVKYIEFPK
jgi:putative RNA 2'-phosphotransferase